MCVSTCTPCILGTYPPLSTCTFWQVHRGSPPALLHVPDSTCKYACKQTRASEAHLPHVCGVRALAHECTHAPWGAACPSPGLSGVLGTAGMVPARRNRHSRKITSAANFSSAVQMMIKCYCARENGKEDSLALLSGWTLWAPAPHTAAGLTPCVPGAHAQTWAVENGGPALGPREPAWVQRALGRGVRHPGGHSNLALHLLCSLGLVMSFTE